MTFGGAHRRIYCRLIPTVEVREQGLTRERGNGHDGRGKPGAGQDDGPDRRRRGADARGRLRDDDRGRTRPWARPGAPGQVLRRAPRDGRVPSAHVEKRFAGGTGVPGRPAPAGRGSFELTGPERGLYDGRESGELEEA